MLKKFKIRNYKNFKEELLFDLEKVGGYKFNFECIRNGTIDKCIIYGRNATGKTNLGGAIGDIIDIIDGSMGLYNHRSDRILNADTKDKTVLYFYEFEFDNIRICYSYERFQSGELSKETLCINDKKIYSFDFSEEIFSDVALEEIGAEAIQTEKYIKTIQRDFGEMEIKDENSSPTPFLRYILTSGVLFPNSILYKLEDFVRRMMLYSVTQQLHFFKRSKIVISFSDYLAKEDNLTNFERFLNAMGVPCKLKTVKTPDGHYELFFEHDNLLPFYENASSGTISLVNFYMRYIARAKNPSFIYMDEFDAFYHYEMAEKLVKYFKKEYSNCQVILTTHNTTLMNNRLMRPDCLFILSRTGKITSINNATERELREGHNLEKMYIGGEFEEYE